MPGAGLGMRRHMALGSALRSSEGEDRAQQTPQPSAAVSAGGAEAGRVQQPQVPHRCGDARTSEPRISAPVAILEAARSFTLLLAHSAFTSLPPMTTRSCPQGQCEPSHCCPDKAPLPTQSRRYPGWDAGVHGGGLPDPEAGVGASSPTCVGPEASPCSLEHEGTRAFTLLCFITHGDVFVPACKWAMLSTSTVIPACDHKVVRVDIGTECLG